MGESEWAVKADALVLQYSAADDIDEAILNMGEQIDRLRTENAEQRKWFEGQREVVRLLKEENERLRERAEKALTPQT